MDDISSRLTNPESTPVRRSWWSRNWKWFVPTVILAPLLVVAVVYFTNLKRKSSSDPFELAIAEVQVNNQLLGNLGDPIRFSGWIIEGDISPDGTESQYTFRVAGPKGEANVTTESKRREGKWELRRLDVTPEGGEKIDLMPDVLAREGDDTPKFDPTQEPPKVKGPFEAPPEINVDLPEIPMS